MVGQILWNKLCKCNFVKKIWQTQASLLSGGQYLQGVPEKTVQTLMRHHFACIISVPKYTNMEALIARRVRVTYECSLAYSNCIITHICGW